METFKKFILWEHATRDTIDVKRCYVDIAGGLVGGVLLSQIIFWFLPNRKQELKVKILKEGRYWLCKEREEWYEECRVTKYEFDTWSKKLVKKGILIKKTFKFNGTPKIHVSVDFEALNNCLVEYYRSKRDLLEANMGLVNLLTSVELNEEPTEKEEYLNSIKGLKKELYNKAYNGLNGMSKLTSFGDVINSDAKLKEFIFEYFWQLYNYKDRKQRAKKKFKNMSWKHIKRCLEFVPGYVSSNKFPLIPYRFLAEEIYLDELYVRENEIESKANGNIFDMKSVNVDNDIDDYFGSSNTG